jgi:amino acid adenylation domain-containing protein
VPRDLTDDASQRRDILIGSSPAACSQPACIHDVVRARACCSPEATALRSETVALTYADLEARSDGLARALRALGVTRGAHTGVLMSRTPLALVAVLAILKTGAAFVPLDPHLPPGRLRHIATDAGLTCILCEPGTRAFLQDVTACLLDCTDALWRDEASGEPFIGEAATPDDLAYVIYTSGSTGLPKGVAMAHGAFCNMIAGALRDSRLTAPVTLQFAAWGFDVFLQEIFSTWTAGGTLVVAPAEARRDPAMLLRLLRTEGIARLYLPPVALHQLAEAAVTHSVPTPDLREIVAAGEALRITPALRRWFVALPGCRLINQYGPAESHVVTEHWLEPSPADWPALPPIGRPLPGSAVLLLDPSMNLVPDGVPAEIHIGRQIARGYLNRPDLDAQQFVAAPFAPGLLYRTGDQARRRHDGVMEFLGRLDRQVKIRGYRVELGEIDAVLASHPLVQAAATVVPPAETDAPRLVSYIVPKGNVFDAAAVRRFLASRLAEYMIPAVLIALDRLPVTDNGKLDVAALPSPEPSRDMLDVPYVEPSMPAEVALAAIWTDLLRVARIGVRDDFFALGGHSLLAVRLVSRIRDHFGVDLSVAAVFETPTIAGLAERIFAQQLALESDADIESLIAQIEAMSQLEMHAPSALEPRTSTSTGG